MSCLLLSLRPERAVQDAGRPGSGPWSGSDRVHIAVLQVFVFPPEVEKKLERNLYRLWEDITSVKTKKKKISTAQFNAEVGASFNEFMLSIFGNYRCRI